MNPLEIIFRLCDITNCLSDIVKKQQVIIEQFELEKSVKAEIGKEIERLDEVLDRVGYYIKRKKRITD